MIATQMMLLRRHECNELLSKLIQKVSGAYYLVTAYRFVSKVHPLLH